MKKRLISTACLFSAVFFISCSSSTQEVGTSENAVNSQIQLAVNTNSQNTPVKTETEIESLKKSREVFGNQTNSSIRIVTANPENKSGNAYQGRPAPDDSTFGASMNSKGQFLETRIFSNHSQLAKVERFAAEKKIIVYLKNGKIIELPESNLPTFQTTVPGTILQAAGVELIQLKGDAVNEKIKND